MLQLGVKELARVMVKWWSACGPILGNLEKWPRKWDRLTMLMF